MCLLIVFVPADLKGYQKHPPPVLRDAQHRLERSRHVSDGTFLINRKACCASVTSENLLVNSVFI